MGQSFELSDSYSSAGSLGLRRHCNLSEERAVTVFSEASVLTTGAPRGWAGLWEHSVTGDAGSEDSKGSSDKQLTQNDCRLPVVALESLKLIP